MAEESGLLRAYKDLITSQYRGKPKYMATVTDLLRYSDDIYATAVYMDEEFDLDLAVGAQEDVLGRLVGADRELGFQPHTQDTATLNDEDYRILLKAKVAKNLWKGGIDDLQRIWRTLFDQDIVVIDNQDMTIEVQIRNVPSSVVHEMILQGYIVPKPQSVRLNYNIIRDLDSKYWIGGGPSQHTRAQIRQPYADGGTVTVTAYFGGGPSQHTKIVLDRATIRPQSIGAQTYYGAKPSMHITYRVHQPYDDGGTTSGTQYYGAYGSFAYKYAVRQSYDDGGTASGTHYYGATSSTHHSAQVSTAPSQ